jgi:GT2 family glycosyltransferase
MSERKAARITVGISTYNDYEHLDMLLQSIRWYTYLEENIDLVVCDDGSRDEFMYGEGGGEDMPSAKSIAGVTSKYGATLIKHEQNLGIPSAWNSLANSLDEASEIVVLLNNDILVVPNWLRVIIHFLDANKDNPIVGSAFWNPYNRFTKETMRAILPQLGHTTYTSADQVTGDPLGHSVGNLLTERIGDGQGLGRVMAPCGCGFAFRREVWDEVGPFDTEMTSFHEEIDWGTRCAKAGKASFGFAYPRPYHVHGDTFAHNPELEAGKRMNDSRILYRKKHEVPDDVDIHSYLPYVHERVMSKIPLTELKYLAPDYDAPPSTVTLDGGEEIKLPQLVEKTGEF